MSNKRKVAVVVTARASYSRIKTALKAIKEHPGLELLLIVTASALLDRYGTAVKYIEDDGFDIVERVFMVLEGENPASMAKTTGIGVLELTTVFGNLRPDIVVTVADRYETMSTAIAASYMNIPLAHIQGGEVSGSIDGKVRHAITKLSDVHLVATEKAKERVIKMGEIPSSVFYTGCPSIDLVEEVYNSPEINFDFFKKYGGVGNNLDLSDAYVVALQHPVTTEFQMARKQIEESLFALNDLGFPVLWFWPNLDAGADGTSKGIRAFRENIKPLNMHFFKNIDGCDFLRLLYSSKCIVGNSSVGIRECAYLGVPAVNIGSRQLGRDRGGNVMDVGYGRQEIKASVEKCINGGKFPRSIIYGNGNAGIRIAEILATCELRIDKKLTY
tara:strand:- start:158 stop:1318 length:1161 start_codon:yes stop_codon:yes gene_type:complete